MKAEETIMNDEHLMKLAQVPPEDYSAPPHWWLRANRRVAEAQAEISFKACRKDVIEWLRKNNDFNECNSETGSGLLLTIKNWQKLKEWGLDDDRGKGEHL